MWTMLVLGAVLAVSVATNVMVLWFAYSWLTLARRDPRAAMQSFFRSCKPAWGHVVRINDDGVVSVSCSHHDRCSQWGDDAGDAA